MSELQEATKEFLIESHENLDQLDADLVELEETAAPVEALGRIFRALHTIKGSCSFLGFPHLEAVAHAGEDLLGKLRDGKLELNPAIIDTLLKMVDAIRTMLSAIENTGQDNSGDERGLIEQLNRLASNQQVSGTIAANREPDVRVGGASTDFALAEGIPVHSLDSFPSSLDSKPASTGDSSAVYDASVRINIDLLDKLMAVAGEIVLARNQILQYSQKHDDPAFLNTCRQLNLITTELQEYVMKTRLQPLGNVWNRFPRLVRDAAHACGKKVHLEMEGSETELDKALIEAVRDPLTHLVRNAIDHGIEAPERRLAAGKNEEGCVRLRAYHEGGQVNVEVSDDGGGIDPERIRYRAIEQHLITDQQAAKMSAQTLLSLIFLPGFTTATTVTTVSGRGVGMDVVKTNIERIGGSIDIQSTVGQGATVRIRIPLTLAIIKVLVVTSAGDRYAIPQVSIVELVRVEGEKARKGIQRIHGVQVYRYRDSLLPLVNLNQILQVANNPAEDDAVNIVVLQAADRQFGLVVDRINDTQEIVVKPLWKHLKSVACFAGATVMGNGKVALILDVFGLAQRAGAVSGIQDWSVAAAPPADAHPEERPSVLLIEGRGRERMAIPLSQVARLEEFPRARVERVAERQVVQYCGQILPLIDVDAALRSSLAPARQTAQEQSQDKEAFQVVVYAQPERAVGLIVERILDIVEQDGDVRGPSSRRGVEHTTVIQGQVTEMLDVEELIRTAGEI
ncbi:MAG TPA: chemotaxis protein CheW [Gemmataceae bacterium]|nr:chemotaxis protein CheW [Gemmataceae bacterium]